jgi:hypothetical protein
MSEQSLSHSDTSSLDRLTLALVVTGLGVCTDEAVLDLRRHVESKAIMHTAMEFDASLERANDTCPRDAHFILCDESLVSNGDGSRPPSTRCNMRLIVSAVGYHPQLAKGPASKRR